MRTASKRRTPEPATGVEKTKSVLNSGSRQSIAQQSVTPKTETFAFSMPQRQSRPNTCMGQGCPVKHFGRTGRQSLEAALRAEVTRRDSNSGGVGLGPDSHPKRTSIPERSLMSSELDMVAMASGMTSPRTSSAPANLCADDAYRSAWRGPPSHPRFRYPRSGCPPC